MALLTATLILVASRFFLDWKAGGICQGSACAIDFLLEWGAEKLPDFAAGWFEALRQNPAWLWGFVIAFGAFLWLKSRAWKKTRLNSTRAWAALKGNGKPPSWSPTLTSKLRGLFRSKLGTAIRWAAAGLVFLLILDVLVVLAGWTSFYARSTLGLLCHKTAPEVSEGIKMPQSVTLDISDPCFASGIALEEGQTYRFAVALPGGEWRDGRHPAGPDGFTSAKLTLFVPVRREISEPWLKLMGQVGDGGKESFVIGSGLKAYRARSSGELFLYVNDAVFGLLPAPYWAWPYFWDIGANAGTATITVAPQEGSD